MLMHKRSTYVLQRFCTVTPVMRVLMHITPVWTVPAADISQPLALQAIMHIQPQLINVGEGRGNTLVTQVPTSLQIAPLKDLTYHPKNLPNKEFLNATRYIRPNSLQIVRQKTARFCDTDTIPTLLTELSNNSIPTTVTNQSPIKCSKACTNHVVRSVSEDEMKNIRVRRLESRFRARPQKWRICTPSVTVTLLSSNRAHLENKCNCGTASLKNGTYGKYVKVWHSSNTSKTS